MRSPNKLINGGIQSHVTDSIRYHWWHFPGVHQCRNLYNVRGDFSPSYVSSFSCFPSWLHNPNHQSYLTWYCFVSERNKIPYIKGGRCTKLNKRHFQCIIGRREAVNKWCTGTPTNVKPIGTVKGCNRKTSKNQYLF